VAGSWRRLHNEELHNLYASLNINMVIKWGGWAGDVARIGEMRCKQNFSQKIWRKRPLGRLKSLSGLWLHVVVLLRYRRFGVPCCLHLKGWYPTTSVHGVTTQKTVTWILIVVETSNPTPKIFA
jgi:hypothetical protein